MEKSSTQEQQTLHQLSGIADRIAELHKNKRFHAEQLKVIRAVFQHGKKRIFIRKGRKGGGTQVALYIVSRVIGTMPNKAAYIIGPTKVLQSEICWDNRRLHNYIPTEWAPRIREDEKRIRLANESFVKVEGADNPESSRGWEGDAFLWDEYKDHNPLSMENCYPNLAARDGIWVVIGSPPTQATNHYYVKEQEIIKDPDWAFFHWTAWDNPFLPGGHEWLSKERDKYYARGDGDLWEIEWEAKYVFNARRKVIPNFRPDVHVVSLDTILAELARDKKHLKWVASIDPGYATCFAALFVAYNPYTAQLYILDEIYSTDKNKNSVVDMWPLIEAKQKYLFDGEWMNLYDSAALGFAVEVQAYLRDQGRSAPMVPTQKHKSDEDTFFRAINSSYKDPGRVKVAAHCQGYINEVSNYETDEHDRYPDESNHQLDNNRYIYKFLGFTQSLMQSKVVIATTLPRGYTPRQDQIEQRAKEDFIGYGGEDPRFDMNKIFGGG